MGSSMLFCRQLSLFANNFLCPDFILAFVFKKGKRPQNAKKEKSLDILHFASLLGPLGSILTGEESALRRARVRVIDSLKGGSQNRF